MRVPGGNLYRMATRLIARDVVTYYRDNGRTKNALGLYVTSFAEPVEIKGSVQAVNRAKYQELGLEFQKNYVTLYTDRNIIDLARDFSGDQIIYNGRRYQLMSEVDWFAIDGWTGVLCVEIGAA